MPTLSESHPASVHVRQDGDGVVFELEGDWRITDSQPACIMRSDDTKPTWVRVDVARVRSWDSSIVVWLNRAKKRAEANEVRWIDEGIPDSIRQIQEAHRAVKVVDMVPLERRDPLTKLGLFSTNMAKQGREMIAFLGETVIGIVGIAKDPRRIRIMDTLWEMQQAGAMALPIVGLIAFLVGVTLAYTGAIVLRQYGGDIYVADLVGLSMVREMGAMMTAIVVAGRTGAAYAAQLANMKTNEEIDALETFGMRPFDFLVFPRMAALVLMMPMLVIYANLLGILGGAIIALTILKIPPTAYFVEMATMVGLGDIATGMIKATSFGVIVALSGCFHGLRAEPNAAGVGQAATSAVVTAILWVIVADAVFAVLFNALGW